MFICFLFPIENITKGDIEFYFNGYYTYYYSVISKNINFFIWKTLYKFFDNVILISKFFYGSLLNYKNDFVRPKLILFTEKLSKIYLPKKLNKFHSNYSIFKKTIKSSIHKFNNNIVDKYILTDKMTISRFIYFTTFRNFYGNPKLFIYNKKVLSFSNINKKIKNKNNNGILKNLNFYFYKNLNFFLIKGLTLPNFFKGKFNCIDCMYNKSFNYQNTLKKKNLIFKKIAYGYSFIFNKSYRKNKSIKNYITVLNKNNLNFNSDRIVNIFNIANKNKISELNYKFMKSESSKLNKFFYNKKKYIHNFKKLEDLFFYGVGENKKTSLLKYFYFKIIYFKINNKLKSNTSYDKFFFLLKNELDDVYVYLNFKLISGGFTFLPRWVFVFREVLKSLVFRKVKYMNYKKVYLIFLQDLLISRVNKNILKNKGFFF